jgi:hypothetical protein
MTRGMDDWQPRAPRPGPLTWPVPLDPTGRHGPTRGQARGPGWRRTSQGLHVPATTSTDSVEQRIVEASARLRGRGAVTGWAALRMHGGGYFDGRGRDGRAEVPVALVAGSSRVAPADRSALVESEVVERYGVRVTTVERAVLDELRRLRADLRETVVAIDMAVAAGLTTVARLRGHLRTARGVPLTAWEALGLADEHSLSPQETRLRLIWVLDADLPPPLCNPRVLSTRTGAFVGMPDLLEPETGMVAEFDGAAHRTPARHRADTARLERLADAGLETCTIVGADLRDVRRVVRRLRATYQRAAHRPGAWTLDL